MKAENLENKISVLKNEKLFFEKELGNFKDNIIQFFKKVQCNNTIRAAYQDFISHGGARVNKLGKVVNVVLTEIPCSKVDKLPKLTFVKDMILEERGVAQYQTASELSDCCVNMTIHSNRIIKHDLS